MIWIKSKNIFLLTVLILFVLPLTNTAPRARRPRLSLVDWTNYYDQEPQGPGTYAFGYDIEDPETENVQFRDEERLPNGTVIGSYGYVQPNGNIFVVRYVADENGYSRAEVEETSRLKYRTEPHPHSRRRPSSVPILASALDSSNVYKLQSVHESRTRPADRVPKPAVSELPSSLFQLKGNGIDEPEPAQIRRDPSAIIGVEPRRFYVLT